MEDAELHLKGDDFEQEKWLSGGKSTIDSVRDWIKRNQESWEKGGPVFNFSIRTMENDELIGMIEANTDTKSVEGIKEGDANISYGLYPKGRGKGFAVRALNILLDFLREKKLKRAVIRTSPENISSLKIPVRCGFTEAGQVVTDKGEELVIFVKDLH